jgi:hypothetical protein
MEPEYLSLDSFPNSREEPFEITSPASRQYNCIAWAMQDPTRFYWPIPESAFYWPSSVPRAETLEAFIQLFQSIGYELCEQGESEEGFQKVALFEKDNKPTHAARQLLDGRWTSKLGSHIDVSHSLSAMEGGFYGNVNFFLKRKRLAV